MTVSFNIQDFLITGQSFLNKMLTELDGRGIEVSSFKIEHLCFRVKTEEEYAFFKEELNTEGDLLTEANVNGRVISTFHLHKPFQVSSHQVDLVELPSPKKGSSYETGFEHAEFVISESVDAFSSRFPTLSFEKSGNKNLNPELCLRLPSGQVKFHYQPLDRIIEIEQASIKDIVFDLDGTIVQSRDIICEINRQVFSEILKRTVSIEETKRKFHPEFSLMFEEFGVIDENLKRRANESWVFLSDQFNYPLFEDIKSLIESLSQTPVNLHVWTARDEASTSKILKHHNIESLFKTISCSTNGHSKPDCKNLKFNWRAALKNSYLVIGDSDTDIFASKNISAIGAGALWCRHSNENSLSRAGADVYFYTIDEFSHWILPKINA